MEKENNKKITPEINEELMMNIMVDGVKKDGLELPQESVIEVPEEPEKKSIEKQSAKTFVKSKNSSRKNTEIDYEKTFFRKTDTHARDGKTVYIRPTFHEKLTRIIQVIGEDKISIYNYLDNLLIHHFDEFSDQIIKNYNDKHKPIL
ncbi:DUF3408 domain-containing protein [Chishuiella sp.]|uniref:DUF3408 domain-containing protein n=1 Tax=Chishuiella sp. TaxID=1969467 RepID=UPI0028AC83DF|nr:DUF3408 domain-containing protein [Chishuiella sp.]